MKIIIGCRHGEAFKNLKNMYGGKGSGLTENGIKQALNAAKLFKALQEKLSCNINVYKSCSRDQVTETAEIIKRALEVEEVRQHKLYCPIRLGVFDGMSREKQLELYPDACKAHELWEKGIIDITQSEVLVEGLQPALNYFQQIERFIEDLEDNEIHILVGTRSDLSCLKNVTLGQSPAEFMKYRYYKIGYAEIFCGAVSSDGKIKPFSIDELLGESFDKNKKIR